jgi:hypothetical protein
MADDVYELVHDVLASQALDLGYTLWLEVNAVFASNHICLLSS